ncbi:hypothetical protein DL95DRAFT_399785 [Leptodontidium sp. 2 PMI_412]|nr:hypothetical protein DL95DRAFT_399785 [Leptodontidium sp. 2 PMI_412]
MTSPTPIPIPVKFQLLSDLYFENPHSTHPPTPEYNTYVFDARAPYLILAGDIGSLVQESTRAQFRNLACRDQNKERINIGYAMRVVRSWAEDKEIHGRLVVLDHQVLDLEVEGEGREVDGGLLPPSCGQDCSGRGSEKTDFGRGEGVLRLGKGVVWVHGHTHRSGERSQDEVRVISNQRGGNLGVDVTGFKQDFTFTM